MTMSIHAKVFDKTGLRLHFVHLHTKLLCGYLTYLPQHFLFGRESFPASSRKLVRHRHSHEVGNRRAADGKADCKSRIREADAESTREECRKCQWNGGRCSGRAPCCSGQHEPREQSQPGTPEKSLIDARRRSQSWHNSILLAKSVPSLSPLTHREDLIEIGSRAHRARRHAGGFHGPIADPEVASGSRTTGRRPRKPRNHERCEIGNGPDLGTLRIWQGHLEVILDVHYKFNAVQSHASILDRFRLLCRSEAAR